ncbi:C40 family peptidase [Cytobacillus sp. Hm23]
MKKLIVAGTILGSLWFGESALAASYTVQSGDTLSKIANKHQTTLAELTKANPQVQNPNIIYIGQAIQIPSASNKELNTWEEKADQVVSTGMKYIGASYLYGASVTRTDAFDCSSFTYRAFNENNGIKLPRTSVEQSKQGTPVAISDIRKGDLIFFDTNKDGVINHVSIVVDSDTILHAGSSTGVTKADLNTYWRPFAVKAVRIIN